MSVTDQPIEELDKIKQLEAIVEKISALDTQRGKAIDEINDALQGVEITEELQDRLQDLAYDIGMEWDGEQFWEPSTC
jgi:hypothetical protein